jgi:hypothetical protein
MNLASIAVTALVFLFTAPQAFGQYYLGPRGGCYTMTRSGNKKYVDRSLCVSDASSVAERQTSRSVAAVADVPSGDIPSVRYHLGPRGGCYALSPSGAKRYVDRSLCTTAATNVTIPKPAPEIPSFTSRPKENAGYYLGPRGGCYTITAGGTKRYVDRAMCQ